MSKPLKGPFSDSVSSSVSVSPGTDNSVDVPMVRSKFSPRYRVAISFSGEGRTKQSHKDECDINRIMSRYMSSGVLPENLNRAMAQFVDCSAIDFQEAQLVVAGAKTLFAELPSAVRSRFHHSAAAFLEFAENPANGPALVEMGLASFTERLATPPADGSVGFAGGSLVPPQGGKGATPPDPATK
ncbi:MAG: internal scaffolding protein [Microvirus sp.]|nr:MAG: internal scaffolding protein [Microvirus sp.]